MKIVNLIEVDRICDRQLKEEYFAIKRVIKRAKEEMQLFGVKYSFVNSIKFPKSWNLGGLHDPFFYNKLKFLYKRFNSIIDEIKERELFKPNSKKKKLKNEIPSLFWQDYDPTELEIKNNLNSLLILSRRSNKKIKWYGHVIDIDQYKLLLEEGCGE